MSRPLEWCPTWVLTLSDSILKRLPLESLENAVMEELHQRNLWWWDDGWRVGREPR